MTKRTLICPAPCLTFVEVAGNDWHTPMLEHILSAGRNHPRILGCLDVQAAFEAILHRSYGKRIPW